MEKGKLSFVVESSDIITGWSNFGDYTVTHSNIKKEEHDKR